MSKNKLKFYQKLVLNQFIISQFGVQNFKELVADMKSPALETIDNEGVTGFHKELSLKFANKMLISDTKLAEYDLNIVTHLREITSKREISLKYFQYLTLLFIEYYLDNYFNRKDDFLNELNEFLNEFNLEYPEDKLDAFESDDLNKLAIWNATGSGKTLLMHINYHQYMHYCNEKLADGASVILLTPKESLSEQHIEEFELSSIDAQIYNKNYSRATTGDNIVNIIENTKLGEKDGDKTVSVNRFGDSNLVFVDEGHRGSSGDTWFKYRNMLCEQGFSFEYSATFGQAVADDKNLVNEYAKCIIFDYSYKYFYEDGYGKDYFIANMDKTDSNNINLYLTASLLGFYQQKLLYMKNKGELTKFNLDNPLFVFVGSSVNALRTENKKTVSDVITIVDFFKDFTQNQAEFTGYLKRLCKGDSGLVNKNNVDVFRGFFDHIKNDDYTELYKDIIKIVFNSNTTSATLHLENLKGVDGEIRIKLGNNEPFALINVGDSDKLIKAFEEHKHHTDNVSYSESYFSSINKSDSTINILIGAKKFTEGWNSYRVSTMGLMNIGKSEGSNIIQLFGRGVRLRGVENCLKRSNFAVKDIVGLSVPKYLYTLETLNVFGVAADYMEQFKKMLEKEGVSSDKDAPFVITLPVIKNTQYKKAKLMTLRLKEGLNYKKDAGKLFLKYVNGINVELDCYAKVQFESSIKIKSDRVIAKESNQISREVIPLLNFEHIYGELQRYKHEKARYNVNITLENVREILDKNDWYTLLIPDNELEIKNFDDIKRIEKIVITLLFKYFDKLYYVDKNKWEKPLLELKPVDDNDPNFIDNDDYTINVGNQYEATKNFIEELSVKVADARNSGNLDKLNDYKDDFHSIAYGQLMYNPFIYVANKNKEIVVAPVALNESEHKFVKELKKFIDGNESYFIDKELFVIRNKSKKGIGFFEDSGFYPDFIMWIVYNEKQYMTFIDPHGMRNTSFTDEKVELYKNIKEIENNLNSQVVLNSFILSPTKYNDLVDKTNTKDEWNSKNVMFMNDGDDYIEQMINGIVG